MEYRCSGEKCKFKSSRRVFVVNHINQRDKCGENLEVIEIKPKKVGVTKFEWKENKNSYRSG